MSIQTQEVNVILAILAICTTKKLSIRRVIQIYNISHTTFIRRIKGILSKAEKQNTQHILIESEEETLVRYVLDLRSIADLLCTTCRASPVGKQWFYIFVKCRFKFKTRFYYIYDFQRAFYKDLIMLDAWFQLTINIYTKYTI